MKDAQPRAVKLADYRPPLYRITDTALQFEIADDTTRVTAELSIERAPETPPGTSLRLDGVQLELESVTLDGRTLSGNEYQVDEESLTIHDVPERGVVTIVTRIHPEKNLALEGLYKSGGMYCTQCEAEGFRRITYFLDRPDVLSKYTTTIVADASRYPTLLSNGNLVERRTRADGLTAVTWHDPFPKPSYLFALVAGELALLEDEFVTASGRRVRLEIHSEPHNIGQCRYAMDALKRSMRWDEAVYGREYDLDVFMIVAVEQFNMGAMENKGLNIFNTSALLATPDTATDATYQRIEAIVAHEYFHNWSGNRVTCRDWFQLSLKEGFTVFRDAQFSQDMHSRTVFRIKEVEHLRTRQFPEDEGPLAHPVRPDSYIEISNFYTTTVYEKGAEVVRMLYTLLGRERFRRGTDLYFSRHDGQAVTTEDFVRALEDASGIDLTQFRRWYTQAGTPRLKVDGEYRAGTLELVIRQSCPPTPGQPRKEPFHVPVALGLLDDEGRELLGAAGARHAKDVRVVSTSLIENPNEDGTLVVHVKDAETSLAVHGLRSRPVVSLLRGFSAPVKARMQSTDQDLCFLARHDSDGFCRWDAMQSLATRAIEGLRTGSPLPGAMIDVYGELLRDARGAADDGEQKALLAELLALPAEQSLHELAAEIDVEGIHLARRRAQRKLAETWYDEWVALYESNRVEAPYVPDGRGIARRSLRNLALEFVVSAEGDLRHSRAREALMAQFDGADNLTDRLAALRQIVELEWFDEALRADVLKRFHERWKNEKLVIDQWFSVQARSARPGALARVTALESRADFDRTNPNRVRSLYAAFTMNLPHFHAADGSGYRFLAERCVALDAYNPQVAARLMKSLTQWQRHQERRRRAMRDALGWAERQGKLSKDLYEVVTKGIEG